MKPERRLEHQHNHGKGVLTKGVEERCQRDVIQQQTKFCP